MHKTNETNKSVRRRVSFTFYAPRANEVLVLGDFNNWNAEARPMKKDANGLWQKISYLYPGRYEYRFLVDGKWYCDPRNLKRCPNCFGSENTVIEIEARR
jgi:1,4-alpha-glucan branching enzyme